MRVAPTHFIAWYLRMWILCQHVSSINLEQLAKNKIKLAGPQIEKA